MKSIKDSNIIVVKVGTSTLTYPSGMLNLRRIETLVRTICDLQNSGKKMILVSSGAVSAGLAKIGFLKRLVYKKRTF
jgi:glutamate 5-kinase